jgi:hypothetical protein
MTEDEARQKWCPFELGGAIFAAGNNTDKSPKNCIGSACAMWRWNQGAYRITPAAPDMVNIEFDNPGKGYCGLAGKP